MFRPTFSEHSKIKSPVQHLDIEVDDIVESAEKIDILRSDAIPSSPDVVGDEQIVADPEALDVSNVFGRLSSDLASHATLCRQLTLTVFVPGSGQLPQPGVSRRRSRGVLRSSASWGLSSIDGMTAKRRS
jgi:hypothetical protein